MVKRKKLVGTNINHGQVARAIGQKSMDSGPNGGGGTPNTLPLTHLAPLLADNAHTHKHNDYLPNNQAKQHYKVIGSLPLICFFCDSHTLSPCKYLLTCFPNALGLGAH